jgi:hypothetical protein
MKVKVHLFVRVLFQIWKTQLLNFVTNVVVLLNLPGSAKNINSLKMHTDLTDYKLTIT